MSRLLAIYACVEYNTHTHKSSTAVAAENFEKFDVPVPLSRLAIPTGLNKYSSSSPSSSRSSF